VRRLWRTHAGTGISTRYPSTTPIGLALGPDLPRADEPSPGTLDHSAAGIHTLLSLLMPAFSLPPHPQPLTRLLHPRRDAPLPTHTHKRGVAVTVSVVCLSPAELSARSH
jgi:hypothetical protein